MVSYQFLFFEKERIKKVEKERRYYSRNKGKHSVQVPHCKFYFVVLLVLLVKGFSIRLQNICIIRYYLQTFGAYPIDSANPSSFGKILFPPLHCTGRSKMCETY